MPKPNQESVLKDTFGYESFRPGQQALVEALLAGRDALGIMPTGAGKSICYQVPALCLPGVTIVVSPLISLMKDQVNALVQDGVAAAFFNSSLTPNQQATALRRAWGGQYKIIYVAPERLLTSDFLRWAQAADISLVTVDEAHCISQWGQDFRPSYLQIAQFVAALPHRPVVGAFTATATERVRDDIVQSLALREPLVEVTGFDRPNLYFEVRHPQRKMQELCALVRELSGRSGIIYCATRKNVEKVYETLQDAGVAVARYHAGLEPAERQSMQDDFLYDRKPVMVATNAFGMGIDKSNVAFVIHYNMPKNIESYYQEAGRAGRDGEPARCVLLYNAQDVRTQRFLIEKNDEEDALDEEARLRVREQNLHRLRQMEDYCSTTDCLRAYMLRYFGEAAAPCGHCGNCDNPEAKTDALPQARAVLACVRELESWGRAFGRVALADILAGEDGHGQDELGQYGALSSLPLPRVRFLLDRLLAEGYLCASEGKYPVVQPGARADELDAEDAAFWVRWPEPPARRRASMAEEAMPPEDAALFARLRELRAGLAARQRVPAFVVFSDATLTEMAARQPLNERDFMHIKGVGSEKARRYGEAFTACIRDYVQGEPAAPQDGDKAPEPAPMQEEKLAPEQEQEVLFAPAPMQEIEQAPAPTPMQEKEKIPAPALAQAAPSAPSAWTEAEEAQLAREIAAGLPLRQMVESHGRSLRAICGHILELDLELRP